MGIKSKKRILSRLNRQKEGNKTGCWQCQHLVVGTNKHPLVRALLVAPTKGVPVGATNSRTLGQSDRLSRRLQRLPVRKRLQPASAAPGWFRGDVGLVAFV